MSAQVHSTWSMTLKVAIGAAVAVTLVLLAFAWPTYTSTPKDLPLAVAGPARAVDAVSESLAKNGDVFEVEQVGSRAEAIEQIKEHEAYGAVVLGADGTEVLTASAASPVAAQILGQVAQGMGEQSGQKVTVTDAVPLSDDDPRGAGLAVAALPLAMGGMIGGVLISLLLVGPRRRVAASLIYGALGGLALAAVLGPWFGFIGGGYLINAAMVGLALAATAATISGFQALLGQPGIGLGAVVTMFVGNPLSGANSPKEFLPGVWGEVGQLFVPGAASSLLRLHTYFPEAGTVREWLVLIAWFALGALLTFVGHFRNQESVHIDGATEEELEPAGR